MTYHSRKRYRIKAPYIPRNRRYGPKMARGGGYNGPRSYSRNNFRYEPTPSSSPEPYSRKPSSEHYSLPSRDYTPEVQQLIFELNQLKNQRAAEQYERTERDESPQGNLLREMLDESSQRHSDFDTVERAEAYFKRSTDEEQQRLDNFTEWIENTTSQSHPEPMYNDGEIAERAQPTEVDVNPSMNRTELTSVDDILNADMELLSAELYASPLEAKEGEEPIEQAESGTNY